MLPLFILSMGQTGAKGGQGSALSRGAYSQTSFIFVLAKSTLKIELGVRKWRESGENSTMTVSQFVVFTKYC